LVRDQRTLDHPLRRIPAAGLALATLLALPMAAVGKEPTLPTPCSIVKLLATPDKYDGKRLEVSGYLVVQEELALFMSKADVDHFIYPNAILLDLREYPKKLWDAIERYVTLRARFSAKDRFNKGFGGSFDRLEDVFVLANRNLGSGD
jgi:hypothetical protein